MTQRRRIFLDVGAHQGETLTEVASDKYLFDIIHCFEPMPEPFARLTDFVSSLQRDHHQSQILLHDFGLSDSQGEKEIYGEGHGASLFADKMDIDKSKKISCRFVKASDFFRQHISTEDLVVMKLNCEGAEVLIINNLLDEKQIFKVANMMICFDAYKVESLQDEPKKILARFKQERFSNYSLPRYVMRGKTHRTRIRNWLSGLSCAPEIMRHSPSFAQKLVLLLKQWKHVLPSKRALKKLSNRILNLPHQG